MEYIVHDLARIVGISPRTLRHYDAIDLLKPARHTASDTACTAPAKWTDSSTSCFTGSWA